VFCHICGGGVAGDESTGTHERLRARLGECLNGRYRVLHLLGAGGMGVVFLADSLEFDRKVAIKVLLPELGVDASVVERFGREAKTAAALDHAGIVRIYEYGSDRGLHYFVMQYVEGKTLQALLPPDSRMPVAFVSRILREAASALDHAHRRGVVHRDVKPENIMIDAAGRVLLTDFGISKVARTADSAAATLLKLTGTGGVVGTPHYMAPEHALGQPVDGRTDQYALAVVGFQMLAGRVPFDDETAPAILHLHINSAPPPLASLRDDVPPKLAAAIERAMSKSPSHRFPTIVEFAAAVAMPSTARPARWRGRLWAAAVVLAALSGGSWLIWQRGLAAERPSPPVTVAGAETPAATPPKIAAATEAKTPTLTRTKTPAPTRTKPLAPTRAKPPAAAPPARPQPVMTLNVTSMPTATLYVGDRLIGQTPIKGHTVTGAGDHVIRLERPGYRTITEIIRVTETRTVRRYYGLRREQR
jgi:predicted Ser/Thr protein kinase